MSRSRFGWLVGLGAGLGFVTALLVRVVHARRSDLGARGRRAATVEPRRPVEPTVQAVAAPAPPAPVDEVRLGDDVVIDLTDGATWLAPVDGDCPEGYPVKAKLSSGIFHLPGMAAYGRTHPDRCYASAEDALVDGLRAAKR